MANNYLKCVECSSMNGKLYEDPREAPLDIGNCLCINCLKNAITEKIEILEKKIILLKIEIKKCQ
ncbi:MAG: hypothetical protein ACTSYR_04015 [Candidatus Odinarchaeia archaeon]